MSDSSSPLPISEVQPKMQFTGTVKKIDLAGAVVDIGAECPSFLHISQIKPAHAQNVGDVLSIGQEITVWVREVDKEHCQINLTMIKPPAVEWRELKEGQTYEGTVVRVEKFGVFVDIGAERPGLVHISELSADYVEKTADVVAKGDEVNVQVIGVNRRKNQIDLSMKALAQQQASSNKREEAQSEEPELPTAMALAMQRALAQSEDSASEEEPRRKNKGADSAQDEIIRRTLERHQQE
ncbi:MAG: S1 RNA-binding domain-containing protein [Chloroflexota bacterium]|jgi:small subunit ribosomal protein S1